MVSFLEEEENVFRDKLRFLQNFSSVKVKAQQKFNYRAMSHGLGKYIVCKILTVQAFLFVNVEPPIFHKSRTRHHLRFKFVSEKSKYNMYSMKVSSKKRKNMDIMI